jgi:hypothetical protein
MGTEFQFCKVRKSQGLAAHRVKAPNLAERSTYEGSWYMLRFLVIIKTLEKSNGWSPRQAKARDWDTAKDKAI